MKFCTLEELLAAWRQAETVVQLSGKGEDMSEWPESLRVRQHIEK